jgi:4-amino-4-deoxy-L-arabinose transferase-like glycosyltransferase
MSDAPQVVSVRTPRLRRHLSLVIALKVLALTALWWFFFRSELRPPADSASVATQVLGDQILNTQTSGTTI